MDKTEALRLADALIEWHGIESFESDAADELRRLSAVEADVERKSNAIQRLWRERDKLRAANAALLGALKEAADALEIASNGGGVNFYQYAREVRDAIKAVEGEKT